MRTLLASLALAGLAGPAVACINDTELPNHEREFRSQYQTPAAPAESPGADSADPGRTTVLLASGAVLLVGAAVVAVARPRAEG
jgi:hypothetical protein